MRVGDRRSGRSGVTSDARHARSARWLSGDTEHTEASRFWRPACSAGRRCAAESDENANRIRLRRLAFSSDFGRARRFATPPKSTLGGALGRSATLRVLRSSTVEIIRARRLRRLALGAAFGF